MKRGLVPYRDFIEVYPPLALLLEEGGKGTR